MGDLKTFGILFPGFESKSNPMALLNLKYNGPTFSEVESGWKRDDPNSYNKTLRRVAIAEHPTSEIIRYKDANNQIKTETNPGAGYLSGTDPIGLLYVEGTTLNKPMQWLGKKALKTVSKILPSKSKFISVNNDMSSTISGRTLLELISDINSSYNEVVDFLKGDYWRNHLKLAGMTDLKIDSYVEQQLANLKEAVTPNGQFSGIKIWDLAQYKKRFGNTSGTHGIMGTSDGKVAGRTVNFNPQTTKETMWHEYLHAANKGGKNYLIGKPANNSELNEVGMHNEAIKATLYIKVNLNLQRIYSLERNSGLEQLLLICN